MREWFRSKLTRWADWQIRWDGWSNQITPRAWRLLVIAVLLGLGAAADYSKPRLEVHYTLSMPAAMLIHPVAERREKAPAKRTFRRVALPSGSSYRRSAVVMWALEDLRARDLMLPIPDLRPGQLRDSFNNLRGNGTRRHRAVDIPAYRGTPVLAVDDGYVVSLNRSREGGITLYASDPTGRFVYFYAHLDRYHERMAKGLPLLRGDTIGFVGATGNAVGHPHLHFAVSLAHGLSRWTGGTPINPVDIWRPRDEAQTQNPDQ